MSLKEIREKRHLTRLQLSNLSGVNIRTIEAYEQGNKDLNNAKIKTLLKICQALECELEDILTDNDTLDLLRIGAGWKK